MLRFFRIASLTLAIAAPSFGDFSCPAGATLLESKDEAQWMKACKDAQDRLHGPFEIWTRPPAGMELGQAYRKTTEGRYAHELRVGMWSYWNIEGVKVSEKSYP